MPSELEIRGDSLLERRQVELLESHPFDVCEATLSEVRERRSLRQRKRVAKGLGGDSGRFSARPLDERPEALQVELTRFDANQVAALPRDDSVGAEELAKRVHGDLQGVGGRLGRIFAPERVNQPVA